MRVQERIPKPLDPDSTLMKVTLNGEAREVSREMTVAKLLEEIGTPAERVAVEVNLEVVPRQEYTSTLIRAGDSIEVVTFVGGG